MQIKMDEEFESLNQFTFTWTIENYFTGFKKVGESIKSPNFFNKYLDDEELYVDLYPMGDKQEAEGYISCYFRRQSSGNLTDRKDISYKLEIIDIHRKVCYSQSFELAKIDDYSGPQKTVKLIQLMGEMDCTTLTVRLLIILKNVKVVYKKKCIAKSKFVLDRHSITWELKKLSIVESRNFYFHNKNFELVIDVPKHTFKIKLQKNLDDLLQYMKCKFSLLDTEGINIATKTVSRVFVGSNETLQIPTFFTEDLLFTKECSNNDSFTLICDFFFPNGLFSSNVEYIEDSAPVSIPQQNTTLCGDFQRMYVDKIFSDVKFRIDSEILLAHKSVLAVRSPVFLAMFSQNMSEKETGVVDISDVDSEIFDEFLKYFYSGTVDNMNYERALKLAVLADKYQVLSLLEMCAYFLASNITNDNVLEILLTADAIQQNQLKRSAVSYIKLHATNILKTNQWQECIKNNIHLATEVLTQITSDLNNYFHN